MWRNAVSCHKRLMPLMEYPAAAKTWAMPVIRAGFSRGGMEGLFNFGFLSQVPARHKKINVCITHISLDIQHTNQRLKQIVMGQGVVKSVYDFFRRTVSDFGGAAGRIEHLEPHWITQVTGGAITADLVQQQNKYPA